MMSDPTAPPATSTDAANALPPDASSPPPPGCILQVAVPSPLFQLFDYLPPLGAETGLCPGMRVRVPFGRREQIGVVMATANESEVPRQKLKRALALLDEAPLVDEELRQLLLWASHYYHYPLGEVVAAALPLTLRRGRVASAAVEARWRATAEGLAALAAGAVKRAPRQQRLLQQLSNAPGGVSQPQLRASLGECSAALKALAGKGWAQAEATPAPLLVAQEPSPSLPTLNAQQAAAVAAVEEQLGQFAVFLLDGVTGSGKTEVYLRLIETVIAQGRQVLVLVPEIGLTPQIVERCQERFPGPLAVLHSALGDKERHNAWLLARSGEASIVIGTRSAVFAPLVALGLIIIDEEHDGSFKQQEGFRYSARDLAVVRAKRWQVPILMGSATPSLESLLNVRRQRYRYLRLPQRVGVAQPPRIELLDVRGQRMEEGLSAQLLAKLEQHLAEPQQQALLFLNRRGFAPVLLCHDCGWLSDCHRCDAKMTLHARQQRLICHHCLTQRPLPVACPQCQGSDLRPIGQGTERIEAQLQERFAAAGVVRIDRDSTRRQGSLEALLAEVQAGRHRLLIGTQMLAKGHHFPNVTLVGILDVDQGLFGVDFRASERMAQLLLQVAGRAGRVDRVGTVIIQTHHPGHPLLQLLISQGYGAFADAALAERRAAQLPPYSYQALVRAEAPTAALPHHFLSEAADLGHRLGAEAIELLGPVPAPMERRAGRYRAQLLVQCEQRGQLQDFLKAWLPAVGNLKSARRVRWSLDVDPQDLL